LRGAKTLAEKIWLPGELWQIQSKIGYLCEQRGQIEEALQAFSLAAQTLRMLVGKIGDEELREGFLSAPRARRVLTHNQGTERPFSSVRTGCARLAPCTASFGE